MAEAPDYIEIFGSISSIVYVNEENGYTVLRLDTGDGGLTTVVGTLPSAAVGEDLRAFGAWMKHPTHGEQFKAEFAERSLPKSVEAIYAYLAGGAIRGIGPATASLIVDRFGDKSLQVLEESPEKLTDVKGVSMKKALQISEYFKRQAALRRLMEFLCAHELRPILAMRLYKFYGDDSMAMIHENPYILALPHIGGAFSEADTLALELGVENDSAPRICAAIVFELQHNSNNGHCFIPAEKLISATADMISVPTNAVSDGLDALTERGEVIRESVAGCDACYLEYLHEAEEYAASRLRSLMQQKCLPPKNLDAVIARVEASFGVKCAPLQRRAIELAAESPVLVLTGGPGTGKTTTVRAILALYDELGIEAVLTAPTGRAAKRMTELTGRDAATAHRLLGAAFSEDGEGVVFQKDESDPLSCGAVILDECSMVDITLMRALLAAMPADCRLILVGDADQLPSVGPGNVFSDIIRSEMIPTVRLNEIFRQSEGSRVVRCAHEINRGEHPAFTENSGDMFFLRRREPARAAETVVELCAVRLPGKMGIPPEEIQILTPTRRGECGTYALNRAVQNALNPPVKGKNEKIFGDVVFREGDRVMQIRNNYDILWQTAEGAVGAGIYNGDVGYILGIDPQQETVTVDFDGRVAVLAFDSLVEIEHAWAMTVHKAQGSEYRAVVLCLCGGAPQLLYRGVLYTAVTRAKKLLVIVGDDDTANRMIDNHKRSRRYSGLRARLCQ